MDLGLTLDNCADTANIGEIYYCQLGLSKLLSGKFEFFFEYKHDNTVSKCIISPELEDNRLKK